MRWIKGQREAEDQVNGIVVVAIQRRPCDKKRRNLEGWKRCNEKTV